MDGGGSEQIRTLLSTSSELVAKIERDEQVLFKYESDLEMKLPDAAPQLRSLVSEFRQMVEQRRTELSAGLQRSIALVRRDKLNGDTFIFLIQYDRSLGRIVQLQKFDDDDRPTADSTRFALELENVEHPVRFEVVLLDERELRKLCETHRRISSMLEELVESTSAGR